jgi:hypothetical protein
VHWPGALRRFHSADHGARVCVKQRCVSRLMPRGLPALCGKASILRDQPEHALHAFPPWLRALSDHDGPFLDFTTAHHAHEYGGADALRAQTHEQVIRMT